MHLVIILFPRRIWYNTKMTLDYHAFSRNQRAKPIIIDPGLYLSKKSDIAWTTQRRSLPTSFKLFTGALHPLVIDYA